MSDLVGPEILQFEMNLHSGFRNLNFSGDLDFVNETCIARGLHASLNCLSVFDLKRRACRMPVGHTPGEVDRSCCQVLFHAPH